MSLLDTWTKLFSNFQWQNRPSTSTPLGRSKLQLLNNAIDGIDDRVLDLKGGVDDITTALDDKVDKVAGKGLSTNDFDNTYKDKLDGISAQANKVEITPVVTEGTTLATISIDGVDTAIKGSDIEVDDEMSPTSTNPVENKVIYETLQNILPEETAEGNPISITDASGLNAKSCSVTMLPIQDLHGQSAPYPAGGSANIWDEETVVSSSRLNSKNYISVSPSTQYRRVSPENIYVTYYDSSKEELGHSSWGKGNFTTPENCYYIKIMVDPAYGTTYNNDISINYPSTDETYHPYSNICPISGRVSLHLYQDTEQTETPETTHTATFPSTVYGGKLNFVSGDLTDKFGIRVFDGTEQWGRRSSTGVFYVNMDNYNMDERITCYCNEYKPIANSSGASGIENCECRLSSSISQQQFYVKDNNYTNVDDFKDFLAQNPIYLCYELATPTTTTLTPETIALLKGNNTLWTDGDSVKLVYSADIKSYIAEQLSSLS